MSLSALKILEINEFLKSQGRIPLIENLDKEELENPRGCDLGLRVGKVYRQEEGLNFLGINKKKITHNKGIDCNGNKICLYPEDYFLIETMELVRYPDEKIRIEKGIKKYLEPIYHEGFLRKFGIKTIPPKLNPGYFGKLEFGLANIGGNSFSFEIGALMFNIGFEPVIGEFKNY